MPRPIKRAAGLAELAAAYATACDEANARLRRCIDYLRRGFRSEAINLAEMHPKLLEMVAALDIPEIDQWEHLCAMYECARPPRIAIESAAELNEAYAQEQELADLLAEHRFQAVARGTLDLRLAAVRQLAARDRACAFWGEDQDALERLRLVDLRQEAATAIKARSLGDIERLLKEVSAAGWRATIPWDIKPALDNAAWTLHAEVGVVELQKLAEQMRAALQGRSHGKAVQLLAKWREVITRYQLEPPQELLDDMLALRQWVTEVDAQNVQQAEFTQRGAALRALIDVRAPEEELRHAHQVLKGFDFTIPDDLEWDYQRLIKELVRQRKMEQYGIYALVALVLLVLLGALVMIFRH